DDSREITDPDNVPYTILIFEENKKTRDHILHQTLRSKAYGESGKAGARQNRTNIEAQFRDDRHKDNHDEDSLNHASNDMAKGFGALFDAVAANGIGRRNQ